MSTMLAVIVVPAIAAAGLVLFLVSIYVQSLSASMDDCYQINRLLGAYTQESEAFESYMLYQDQGSLDALKASRSETDEALQGIHITPEDSKDQYLLLLAIKTSLQSHRNASVSALSLRQQGADYASAYARTIRIGTYIEEYLRSMLHDAISQGQMIYQRDIGLFRLIPLLFLATVVVSMIATVAWTRWMVDHVVRPVRSLIRATGELSENVYHTPDLEVLEEDELSQLSRTFNEMKHSTARLVDSLKERNEMESELHAEALRRSEMELAMDKLRLSLLQSQINPHFLFNTLNIISRMAQMEEAPLTEELIKRLSHLFRYNLQSVDDIVPLREELRIVADYMAIQKIRFGDRIDFTVTAQADMENLRVPVFTLQPLIENAVIHGVSPVEEGGSVCVDVRKEGASLCIRVADTGQGMEPDKLKQLMEMAFDPGHHVSGLGLGNVRARVMAFRPASTFTIRSTPGQGTEIVIEIPLEEVGADE